MTIKDLERLKAAGLIRDYSHPEVISNRKKPKFGNIKTQIDGHIFDSQKEANRYIQLRYLLKNGSISDLECQKSFQLSVCVYRSDFSYKDENGALIVEDVKSPATRKLSTYRLKKKLMAKDLGIEIREV